MSFSAVDRIRHAAVILLVTAACAACGGPASRGDRPPVILVVVDALRADALGCYGFEGDVSPNIDTLAAESVVFERCRSQAPWTKPSVASLLTSLEPQVHGVVDHDGVFAAAGHGTTGIVPEAATTLAETLADHGYVTAAFVANPWLVRGYGFEQGLEVYEDGFAGLETTADAITAAVAQWLEERDRGQPFFLYLHLMDVHGPYLAKPTDLEAVASSPSLGADRELTAAEYETIPTYLLGSAVHPSELRRLRAWRAAYAAGVRQLDRRMAALLDLLRRHHLLDDSVLVVTSDHGEELFEHGGSDHGWNLFEHQLWVPLVVRLPGAERGGTRCDDPVQLLDLAPTLLALAGAASTTPLQGRDLTPQLRDAGASEPAPALAAATKHRPGLLAWVEEPYKLVADRDRKQMAVFDLAADPAETHNIAPEQEQLGWDLLARALAHIDRVAAAFPALDAEQAPLSPEVLERLRALGYGGAVER